jgi:hypothetical protein
MNTALRLLLYCLPLLLICPTARAQSEPESATNVMQVITDNDRKPAYTVREGMHVKVKMRRGGGVVKGDIGAILDSTLVIAGDTHRIRDMEVLTFRYPNRVITGGILTGAGIASIVLISLLEEGAALGLLFVIAYYITPVGLVLLLLRKKRLDMNRHWWRVERGQR